MAGELLMFDVFCEAVVGLKWLVHVQCHLGGMMDVTKA